MTEPLSKNDLRRAVLQRLDTFTDDVKWIGDMADYAFADSIIEFAKWYAATLNEAARLRVLAARGVRTGREGL